MVDDLIPVTPGQRGKTQARNTSAIHITLTQVHASTRFLSVSLVLSVSHLCCSRIVFSLCLCFSCGRRCNQQRSHSKKRRKKQHPAPCVCLIYFQRLVVLVLLVARVADRRSTEPPPLRLQADDGIVVLHHGLVNHCGRQLGRHAQCFQAIVHKEVVDGLVFVLPIYNTRTHGHSHE